MTDKRNDLRTRCACLLLLVFVGALLPRLYSATTLGWHWDAPGSFTLVNFDEAGSCRAALGGFSYSPFIGYQTIALASIAGSPPPADIYGDAAAVRAYCHGAAHIRVARLYSAVTGALTPVALGVIGLLLLPAYPAVGLTAAALLAISGLHIGLSHSGTVDAPSVFFIHLFLAIMVFAVVSGRRYALWTSPVLLVPALWAKYWVFALFAYAALVPQRLWQVIYTGWTPLRLGAAVMGATLVFGCLSNTDFPSRWYPLLALFYALVPWRRLHPGMRPLWLALPLLLWGLLQVELIATYTQGGMTGRFGTGYGAIGWHKWVRNALNLPLVLMVGLGLPAFLCLLAGARVLWREPVPIRGWLCLLPVLAFALFMLVPAPVTYYRHYLPLLPGAALLAALGFWRLPAPWPRRLLLPFLCWPALLAVDLVLDYHRDPRVALRAWYDEARPSRVFASYYVSPPRQFAGAHRIFTPEYASGETPPLLQAQYLVLSENWYDTAFPSELNGPLVGDLSRLVKTRPEYARFYRRALAGELPYLERVRHYPVRNFMPELVAHKRWYGTFQMFVGDIHVFRVRGD